MGDATMLSSLASKDDYLGMFQKSLDKLYLFDQVGPNESPSTWESVKNRVFPKRQAGQLPAVLKSYLQHADLFCEGEPLDFIHEETWTEGAKQAISFNRWKPFWNKCKGVAMENHPW